MAECSRVTNGVFCGLLLPPSFQGPEVSDSVLQRAYLCECPTFLGLGRDQLK